MPIAIWGTVSGFIDLSKSNTVSCKYVAGDNVSYSFPCAVPSYETMADSFTLPSPRFLLIFCESERPGF